ncbi:MAG: xanthine dehydrogenase family protein subunit M [Pseudomonadota bacterium]
MSYERPTSLAEAQHALSKPGAKPLAGGTDLIVQLRERRREADVLVDLKHVIELREISETVEGGLSVGPSVSATDLLRDGRIPERYPALAVSLGMIGSRQIQNRCTLGGNVCNAAPSADAVPPLICYGAQCHITGPSGERTIAIEELFKGPGRTSLAEGEILVRIELPPQPTKSAAHYIRFTPRREMDIAVVGSGAWIARDGGNTITAARIALASVAPTPIRSCSAEAALLNQPAIGDTFAKAAIAAKNDVTPISDTRGSADYRKSLVETLTRRALEACAAQIQS